MSWPPLPFRLYAHRGSSEEEPENTLEAFHRALAEGADALELDVHLTRDGRLVVSHDADGRRTAGVDHRIAEATLAEVKRWNVGAVPGGRAGSVRRFEVPTLEEVLEACPGVPMSVDLKPDAPAAVPLLTGLLARRGVERTVIVGSFHSRVTRAARRAGYPGPTALTRPEIALLLLPLPLRWLRVLVAGTVALVPRSAGRVRLDGPGFIGRCRRLGVRVDFWVVNDPGEAAALASRGATGIVADSPARMAPALRVFRSP